MARRLTIKDVDEIVNTYFCELISNEYVNKYQILDFKCKCGNFFSKSLSGFKKGPHCKDCGKENYKLKRSKRVTVSCAYCKKPKQVVESLKKLSVHYCNQACRTEHMKTTFRGVDNPNFRRIETSCDGCGKLMLVVPYRVKNHKYQFCSHKCYKIHIGKFFSGENNNNYNPNLSDGERGTRRNIQGYDDWRLKVYERDKFTCVRCGDNRGGNLTAHHKDGYHWCKERRTDVSNGVTLCETCHIDFHSIYGYRDNTEEQFKRWLENQRKQDAI